MAIMNYLFGGSEQNLNAMQDSLLWEFPPTPTLLPSSTHSKKTNLCWRFIATNKMAEEVIIGELAAVYWQMFYLAEIQILEKWKKSDIGQIQVINRYC